MNKLIWISITTISILSTIGCQRNLPPKQKAFELVKNSNVINKALPVKRVIQEWLKENKDEVKPIGWKVSKKDGRVYLVSYHYTIYSFNEGSGERVFSFEVDLDTEIVKDVTKEVEKRMIPLEKAFRDENEISEELLKSLNGGGEIQ